ncbi:hypothetical protein Loa_00150 [Legionella oakridgensis ATCC 33761 = DSM 21215]|uniref:Uncharacterized protein n=1 Tax=Legionella oakridgensis ATCC 33761 = DSM 21215 TaxID=1268635 RepID=W0BAN5_9GAMM|nr:hypothetical protein Loa_00150 [Legionella oakridgensis ATCC 33761 = DSM 21215]
MLANELAFPDVTMPVTKFEYCELDKLLTILLTAAWAAWDV